VKRVKSIISEKEFYDTFPDHLEEYKYEDFLHAMAHYPAFCN